MNTKKYIDNLVLENVKLIYRNFAGRETKFNKEGDRNFSVVIDDPEFVDNLRADGWNVRPLKSNNPDPYEQKYHLKVAFSYDNYPPKIYLVTDGGKAKTLLDADSVACLDDIEIENADIIIRPYSWSANGNSGVKAYVKSLYVTMHEDAFQRKYRNCRDTRDTVAQLVMPDFQEEDESAPF